MWLRCIPLRNLPFKFKNLKKNFFCCLRSKICHYVEYTMCLLRKGKPFLTKYLAQSIFVNRKLRTLQFCLESPMGFWTMTNNKIWCSGKWNSPFLNQDFPVLKDQKVSEIFRVILRRLQYDCWCQLQIILRSLHINNCKPFPAAAPNSFSSSMAPKWLDCGFLTDHL